jgi:hypothetical protein
MSLLQVGVNDFDQLIRRIRFERAGVLLGIDQMGADVIFHNLSHQTRDAPANAGNHVHHAFALGFFAQGTLDGLDLAADAPDARKQSLFLSDSMAHATI